MKYIELNIDILDEKEIEKNNKILKDIFFIDIDNDKEWIDKYFLQDILEYEKLLALFDGSVVDEKKLEDITLKDCLTKLKEKKELVLTKIHILSMNIIKKYYINIEELFQNIGDKNLLLDLDKLIDTALYDDMYLDLYLIKELKDKENKSISIEQAFEKYRNFNSEVNKKVSKELCAGKKTESRIISDSLKTYRANIKKINDIENDSLINKFIDVEDKNKIKVNSE